MSKPASSLHVAAWTVGLAGAALLVWFWRQPPDAATPGALAPLASGPASIPAVPPPPARPAPSLDPATEALLTALVRAIARGDARANEAVLAFRDDAALRRFLDRARQAGLTVVSRLDALRSVRVRFSGLDALQRELQQNAADYSGLTANNLVGIPQPPARENRPDVPQVPFRNDTLAFIGATGDRSTWGRGTTIAILDTGLAADPTFGAGRVRTWDIGLGSAPGTGADDGHGTAVAALAAGLAADAGGVAPAASLLSIRVTDASGVSDLFTISQAIVAAVEAGANLINISLGGYATGPVLDAAIDYATQRGALIIAAAGNDQAAQLTWPAADPRVVSVGAIDKAEQQVVFSNSAEQLQLAAPGYGVQTAWLEGRRVYVDGTSASAPLVTGAIAALLSQFPALTARQAADLLTRTANDGGAPGTDAAYGRGIINLATAMNRGNSTYVDTAISSHYYDAGTGQLEIVVQNRSGRTVTGLALDISAGPTTTRQSVPGLAAGETYVATIPVNESALATAGKIMFTSQLVNPLGTVDAVPANNARSSVLSATTPKK